MAKPDQKTSPNKAALAAKRAKLAAQRFSNMSKSLSGDQLQRAIAEAEYVTRQLSSLTDPAKQLQQRLELINSKISQPLDKIRLAVESASLPSQELAEN